MIKVFFAALLAFSAPTWAGDTYEDFIRAQLFGIVAAPTSPIEIPSMTSELNAAIEARLATDSELSNEQILSDLSNRILTDSRWMVNDVVTRAAGNFVQFLMHEEDSLSLLTRIEYSLKKLSGEIDDGWSVRYQGRRVEAAKLDRLESLVNLYNRIHEYRAENQRSLMAKLSGLANLCSVAFGQPFQPQL